MATAAVAIPSHQRPEPGSINIPIATFPHASNPNDVQPAKVASDWIQSFNTLLENKKYSDLSNLFIEGCYWRDHLALSWDLHTFKGTQKISETLHSLDKSNNGIPLKSVSIDDSNTFRSPKVVPLDGTGTLKGVQAFLRIETVAGSGQGVVRLVLENGTWKAFTLFTLLTEIKSYEENTFSRRAKGVEHGDHPGRKNWQERRLAQTDFSDSDPVVLIVGAGQGGLTVAARLKMLGIETLIVDQNDRVGDNWRNRYHQLVLHDPVWYDHMPYVPFPPNWPIFTPKDKLAEFFESYVKFLELNVWMKTSITKSQWDEQTQTWTVSVVRQQEDGSKQERTFHPHHIIQATGHSGKKNFPDIKGMETFKGDRLCHSSEFSGAKLNSQGKKAVIVGSCNSGHDIAQDYYEKGYETTIVQRSSTCVVTSDTVVGGLTGLYGENGPATEDADVFLFSVPSEVLKGLHIHSAAAGFEKDSKTIEGLSKAGFKVDHGPDNAGLMFKYFQRGGGYYIDVGCSQLIIDGKIKVKQGVEITEVLPHGLRFADGTELPADEIVFATGYLNMRSQARLIFGDEVADKLNDVWGFDEEGEMRTIWRKSGHPGFWYMGGNLALCRYFSRILALQIKAIEVGLDKDS